MSGGGGGGGGGSGGSGSGTDCAGLRFRATVESPQPGAVAKLELGAVLAVNLVTGASGPPILQLETRGGEVVGSVITQAAALLYCIQQGFSYSAEVIELSGGNVRVAISAL